jgi:hypothetical protein
MPHSPLARLVAVHGYTDSQRPQSRIKTLPIAVPAQRPMLQFASMRVAVRLCDLFLPPSRSTAVPVCVRVIHFAATPRSASAGALAHEPGTATPVLADCHALTQVSPPASADGLTCMRNWRTSSMTPAPDLSNVSPSRRRKQNYQKNNRHFRCPFQRNK